jgi:hypothetical protein
MSQILLIAGFHFYITIMAYRHSKDCDTNQTLTALQRDVMQLQLIICIDQPVDLKRL